MADLVKPGCRQSEGAGIRTDTLYEWCVWTNLSGPCFKVVICGLHAPLARLIWREVLDTWLGIPLKLVVWIPLCLDPSDGVFGRFDLAALCGCHT